MVTTIYNGFRLNCINGRWVIEKSRVSFLDLNKAKEYVDMIQSLHKKTKPNFIK